MYLEFFYFLQWYLMASYPKFIPKYVMLFDAIVNCFIFQISFSIWLLLEYKKN